jgi:hypothetical protein
MAPVNFIFLANRGNLTKRQLYRDISNRLRREPGSQTVSYDPSRARPKRVVSSFDPDIFLSRQYGVSDARLETNFWFPSEVNHEYYEIEWIEPGRNLGVGWHQDRTHPSLGNCHFQIDHNGRTVCREGAVFLDRHPLNVLEARLEQLRSLLPALDWTGASASLPESGIPTPP